MPALEELNMADTLETEPMARLKAKQEEPEDEPVKTLFAVKGSQAWYKWLKDFADKLGTTNLGVIDESLREYATVKGFRPMPRRIPR